MLPAGTFSRRIPSAPPGGNTTSSEVIVSNTYFQMLPDREQLLFGENDPVDGRNIGLIKSWKLQLGPA